MSDDSAAAAERAAAAAGHRHELHHHPRSGRKARGVREAAWQLSQKINPIGYPFESYDGLGVYRTTENGYPIDSSGAIVGTRSSDRPVANAVELTRALAGSTEVQECFSRQVFRNAFGRQDTARDECAVRDGDGRVPGQGPRRARAAASHWSSLKPLPGRRSSP